MTMQDPIADMFTRIRNGLAVRQTQVTMPLSKIKLSIAKFLKEEGFIKDFITNELDSKKYLTIMLSYYQDKPVITKLKRVSKPSLRVYNSTDSLPRVLGGLGVAIVSTSKGIMSDRQARSMNHGGEIIGFIS
jgi:small subunit ribosomal protein S8